MKKTALLTLMLMVAFTGYGQKEVKSTIKTAQVYTQGAQIERMGSTTLKPGKNEFKINQLSADLDPNTIQIGGTGFTILSVRHEIDFIDNQNSPDKIKGLANQQQILFDSVKLIDLELSILEKQTALLDKNMAIVGDDGIRNDDFQSAVSYFSKRYEALTRKTFELEAQKVLLANRISLINLQISSEGQETIKPSSSIHLVLDSKTTQKIDLNISYAISQAGWFPAYDIRATDTDSPLALTYKARVFQNSGVDWKNVKLKISSGNLEASGTAPQLSPYYVGAANTYRNPTGPITYVSGIVTNSRGEALPQATLQIKGTTLGAPTDASGRYKLQIPPGSQTVIVRYPGYITQEIPITQSRINVSLQEDNQVLGEVVVTGYGVEKALRGRIPGVQIQQDDKFRNKSEFKRKQPLTLDFEQINYQTTFVYDIEFPYDIPSTGKPEVVDIKTEYLEVDYQYIAAPKAIENAYLIARIPDWTDLNLLDGSSNIYFQNSFVGQSIIDTQVGSDTLEVSLGKDEGIIVNRERKKDFEQKRFFSGKKREERHFEITVMNTKKTAMNIAVYDQIPVAARNDIKINIIALSGGSMDEKTGIITWDLDLKPGEKKVLQLKYSVDYPKDENLDIN